MQKTRSTGSRNDIVKIFKQRRVENQIRKGKKRRRNNKRRREKRNGEGRGEEETDCVVTK